jgi:peptidoglycan/LPS O-acetylase OafA/YrhL
VPEPPVPSRHRLFDRNATPSFEGETALANVGQLAPPVLDPARGRAETLGSAGLPKGSASAHLDALRGFAAFSVLLNHWRDAFFVDFSALHQHSLVGAAVYLAAGLGHQWVIVFFVMSGYLVGGSVVRSVSADRWSWRSYLLARCTRLYVVLLPALLLGGMVDWAGMHTRGTAAVYNGQSGMHALTEDVHSTLTSGTFVENGIFLQTISLPGMHGKTIPTLGSNGPLWSLCNEFWYYMGFPLLVLLVARGRSRRVRALCAAGLVLWVWFVGSTIALLGIPWLMGVLVAVLPPFPVRRSLTRGAAIGAGLLFVAGGLVVAKMHEGSLLFDTILGVAVTLLIWITLHCATAPLPAAYVRVAQRAARSSYTLYLVHLPMLIFLKASLHLPRAVPDWHSLLAGTAILLLVLLYAQLVYQIFERKTDRIRNILKPYVLGRQPA